ncbi:MAG: hypothetical protein KDC44_21930, partial [Phaeodactylibacter sp.]|nr:hypothetical protein [Phaeodactylibacter sp.]
MRVYIIPLIVLFLLGNFLPQGKAQDCDCFGSGNCPTAVSLNSSGQVCYDLTDAFNNDLADPTQGICGVAVTFTHAHIWDFELSLTSPSGQTIDLVGPNTNVFGTTNSVLWDITFIPCANAPDPDTINGNPFDPVWDNDQNWPFAAVFDGTYHPLAGNCLEDFDTGPVNGTWCLNYTNQPSTFSGEILNFELILCDNSGILCCDADAGDLSDYSTVQACEGAAELLFDLEPAYTLFEPDTAEYGYTFVIADNAGVLLEYDTMPDLTSYPAGTYSICGLSYKKEEVANIPPVDGSLTVLDLQLDFEGPSPSLCADLSDFCVEIQIAAPPAPVDLTEVICEGDVFEVGTETFNETGMYQVMLEASTTCDSIVNLDLTVLEADSTFLEQTLCVNDSIVLDGVTYDTTNVYYIPYTNQFGCDSTVVLDLLVLDSIETFLTEQICFGESYEVSGNFFDAGGMYTIPLSSALGCDSIVYLDLTVVDIEISFENPDLLTCAQSADTLQAVVTGISGAAVYSWNSQDGLILGPTDADSLTVGAAGTYVLEVTDQNCVVQDSLEVQSDQLPPFAAAGLPDTLNCLVDSVQLDGSNSTTGATISYAWSTLDGNILSGSTGLEPWVDAAGTYQLIVVDTGNSCSDTAAVDIAVDLTPPLANAGPDQVLDCVSQSVELDGSGSLSTGNLQYAWTNSNGDPLPATDSLRITVSEVGWYYLTVVDLENGCQAVDSAEVTDISVLPVVDAGLSDTINCAHPTATLDGTASTSGPGIEYLWTSPAGILQGAVDQNTAVALDSGWYFLQVLNTNNNCLAIDSVLIFLDTIHPLADAGGDLEINCDLTQVLIGNPGGTSLGVNYTYAWENSAGQFLGSAITIYVDTGDDFILTVTDTTNQCSSSDTITVVPDQTYPISDTGPGGTLTCLEPTLILNGGNSTASPFIDYSWYDENGMEIGNDSLQVVSQPGLYCLSVADGLNFCADTSCVEVLSAANFPLVDAGPDQFLDCLSGEALLTGMTSGQGVPFVYEWTAVSGGMVLGDPNQLEVTVSGVGVYELIVTDTLADCASSDQVAVLLDTMACVPIANAGANGIVNCFNFPSTTLDATIGTSTGNFISYQWTAVNGTVVSGANSLMPVVDTGLYVLTVTNELFGLTATDTVVVTSDLVEPIANAGPDA